MLDQRELAHPRIGLPQRKAMPLRKSDHDLAGAVQKPGIPSGNVLGLHGGVDDDTD
jgi:hypothetical protein